MNDSIHYNNCPVCNSPEIFIVEEVKDHSVSKETFAIAECRHCSLRFTQDVPAENQIGPYYQSEDYISHTNTSKGLINRLYQSVRQHTLKSKRKLIEKYTGLQKGQLLDMGSGVGAFAAEMKNSGWQVTGIEPDQGAREIAKKTYGVELLEPGKFYSLQPGQFDAITMWHVLEHVHDLHGYIAQFKKILKEKGCLFIAVPNYTSKDASIYGGYWAAWDVPRHLYHFSPKSIDILMAKHGMIVEKYWPMWFDSFYISLLSSKYKNGKSNLVGAFFNGLRSNMQALQDVKRCSSVIYVVKKGA